MNLYDLLSYRLARTVILTYSTSFSMSSRLFPRLLRHHVMAIYGLVRIADEVVDTYEGPDQKEQLHRLESETLHALKKGYSTNPIVHAFSLTARRFAIEPELIEAFFTSMRMDCEPMTYTQKAYDTYIYGSAEVIGLMCLRVFVDESTYDDLKDGARKLGSAYQKINFLRDIREDAVELNRWYFPNGSYLTFDDEARDAIVAEIREELSVGEAAAAKLPATARPAVALSIDYFSRLLYIIARTPAATLKTTRVRLPNSIKTGLLLRSSLTRARRV